MTKVIAFLYKHGKAVTSATMVVTLGVTMVLSGALLTANAGSLTVVSDTLTESCPSSASDHTITFTAANAGSGGNYLEIGFAGYSNLANITTADVVVTGVATPLFTDTVVSKSGSELHIKLSQAIAAGEIVTVTLAGTNKLTNPSSTGSALVEINTVTSATSASIDYGLTYTVILQCVRLHAYVAPISTFKIEGMTVGDLIDGEGVASTSTATYAGFGTLTPGTPVMMGSSLSYATNAGSGFTVTVHQNHNLLASSGADIDCFKDGVCLTTGGGWTSPLSTLGDEKTYGHLGLHSEDGSNTIANVGSVSTPTDGDWFGLSGSTPVEVWDWNAPSDGYTQDIGHIDVGYRVQVGPLQEYGHYYNCLTYIITPVF